MHTPKIYVLARNSNPRLQLADVRDEQWKTKVLDSMEKIQSVLQ